MSRTDVLIVGAGIFGLSIAWSCRQAGLSVRVLEGAAVGQGASGGVVGALTPHAPTRWRPMKQFQFDALLSLETRIAELQSVTGLSAGYARTGRLSPLPDVRAREKAEAEAEAALAIWGDAASLQVLDDIPAGIEGWIAPEAAPCGLIEDTLSARVDPRAYLAALAAALGDCIETGIWVTGIDAAARTVQTANGPRTGGVIVIAAGTGSWSLGAALDPGLGAGSAVKGQAAVLAADAEGVPVIWQQGLYIIPHGQGRVAVGSTSEKRFDHDAPDHLLDDVVAKAHAVVPRLREAPVVERWAGLRPKPPGREPVVGEVSRGIWVASGGFKIGFGIAHAVGDAVAVGITGDPVAIPLPETFAPALSGPA